VIPRFGLFDHRPLFFKFTIACLHQVLRLVDF
jgi:hypothetical protein